MQFTHYIQSQLYSVILSNKHLEKNQYFLSRNLIPVAFIPILYKFTNAVLKQYYIIYVLLLMR